MALVPAFRCSSADSENQATTPPPPPPPRKGGPPTYTWSSLIGGIGVVETAYLTYVKVTSSDALCAFGGGSCGDVLNSDYASVFGERLDGLSSLLALQSFMCWRQLPRR